VTLNENVNQEYWELWDGCGSQDTIQATEESELVRGSTDLQQHGKVKEDVLQILLLRMEPRDLFSSATVMQVLASESA
jgi:hypothetical protein